MHTKTYIYIYHNIITLLFNYYTKCIISVYAKHIMLRCNCKGVK